MKIALDAKRMLNNATGLGNHARILANALMRDFPEHEYLLFAPKEGEEYRNQLHGKYNIVLPESASARILHPWWRSYGVTESLLRNMVDIYHGLSNEIPLNIHRSGIRSIVTIHDLIFLKHKEQYPWIDRQGYIYKTKYAARYADKIIAVSQETKNDLIDMYRVPEGKIAVIYQSIDDRFYIPLTQKDKQIFKSKFKLPEKYILNVGSFFPRKNQLKLIEAFDLIKEDVVHDLVLAGAAGDQKEDIQHIIAGKKLNDRIHLIDHIGNDDMPALYQCADLFVFPSLFEGFGMPVLEALTSGIPVIATRGGAIAEAAGRGSIAIDPMDAMDIADHISLVLKGAALRQKMIDAGHRHAATMTDHIFAQQTMAIYEEVTG